MKTYYMVITYDDQNIYHNLKIALETAERLSMAEEYIDTDIKVVEIQETKLKTFRNGGEVA